MPYPNAHHSAAARQPMQRLIERRCLVSIVELQRGAGPEIDHAVSVRGRGEGIRGQQLQHAVVADRRGPCIRLRHRLAREHSGRARVSRDREWAGKRIVAQDERAIAALGETDVVAGPIEAADVARVREIASRICRIDAEDAPALQLTGAPVHPCPQ